LVTLEQGAVNKIKNLLAEEDNQELKLRLFVSGGGCSGFQYGFTFDESQNEDDFVVEKDGVTLLIDGMSMQYLNDATIDYTKSLMGEQFVVVVHHFQHKRILWHIQKKY
jgi:iron-sulfur cluster insertion protein